MSLFYSKTLAREQFLC